MAFLACMPLAASATALRNASDLTARASYWVDTAGNATLEQATAASHQSRYLPHVPGQGHTLGDAALWLRLEYAGSGGAATLVPAGGFQCPGPGGAVPAQCRWRLGHPTAGDRIPLSRWSIEDRSPVFEVGAASHRKRSGCDWSTGRCP